MKILRKDRAPKIEQEIEESPMSFDKYENLFNDLEVAPSSEATDAAPKNEEA